MLFAFCSAHRPIISELIALLSCRIPAPVIVECGYDVARTEAIVQRFCQADPSNNSWVVLSEVAARPEHLVSVACPQSHCLKTAHVLRCSCS